MAIQAGLEVQVNHAKVRELIKQVELTREITSKTREALLRYLEFKSRAIYIAYLVLTELSKNEVKKYLRSLIILRENYGMGGAFGGVCTT